KQSTHMREILQKTGPLGEPKRGSKKTPAMPASKNCLTRRLTEETKSRLSNSNRGAKPTVLQKLNMPAWNTSMTNGCAFGLLQGESPMRNHSTARPMAPATKQLMSAELCSAQRRSRNLPIKRTMIKMEG